MTSLWRGAAGPHTRWREDDGVSFPPRARGRGPTERGSDGAAPCAGAGLVTGALVLAQMVPVGFLCLAFCFVWFRVHPD